MLYFQVIGILVLQILGNINKGETVEDTYFALRTTLSILIEKNIIPNYNWR